MMGLESCTSLLHLSLSRNSITTIVGLEVLENLTRLDLSFNQITRIGNSLNENLALEHLDLRANKITDINELMNLSGLENLEALHLRDETGKNNNPICNDENYHPLIQKNLKQISILDGGHILLVDCMIDMREKIAAIKPDESTLNTPRTEPWINEENENHPIFNVDTETLDSQTDQTDAKHIKAAEDAAEAVKTVLTFDCSHVLRKATSVVSKSVSVMK